MKAKMLSTRLGSDIEICRPTVALGSNRTEDDVKAECLQSLDRPALFMLLIAFEEEISSQFDKLGIRILKEVIDDGQDRMSNGNRSTFPPNRV